MSTSTRPHCLLLFFLHLYITTKLGCFAGHYGSQASIRFTHTSEVRLIALKNANLTSNDLRRLVDNDSKTCVQGQPTNGKTSKTTIRADFRAACLEVTTVVIVVGRTTPATHSSPYVSLRRLCSGGWNWVKCHRAGERAVQPTHYVCSGHYARAVDIEFPSNLPICELTINYLPLPALTTPIKLVGGSNQSHGTVQVYYQGAWGTVCDDFWTIHDAHVVCHQLGYSNALEFKKEATFGKGEGRILMDNLRCTGTEGRLQDCLFNGWKKHDCDHDEDAGVVCNEEISCKETNNKPQIETNNFPVRLVDGDRPYRGRLEVFVRDQWGSVCDNNFGAREAKVACRQLGYTGYVTYAYKIGQSDGPTWMDNVNCDEPEETGEEDRVSRLADCFKKGTAERFSSDKFWGINNCTHDRDVALTCAKSAKTLPIRLVDGGASHKGRVEVFANGMWGSVCNNSWGWNDAKVVCRQLGFPSVRGYRTSTLRDARESQMIWMDSVMCGGRERRLQDCYFSGWGVHNCSHEQDVGVECLPTEDSKSYDKHQKAAARKRRNDNELTLDRHFFQKKIVNRKDIRLVGGYSSSEGRVEINIKGTWTTICNPKWDINDANAVCNRLGFSGAVDAFQKAYFGEGNGAILKLNINCLRRNPPSFSACSSPLRVEKTCTHSNDVGVICLPHDQDTQRFVYFTHEYNKMYPSGKARNQKAAAFTSNLRKIENLNGGADHHSSLGINKFTDMSQKEFAKSYLMSQLSTNQSRNEEPEPRGRHRRSISDHVDWIGPIPECFDWRDKSPPVVSRVKNQGQCGASYAFATVAQMESIWAIQKHRPLIELSVQQIISCDQTSSGCDGGMPDDAMDYVLLSKGLQLNSTYPYVSGTSGNTESCEFNSTQIYSSFRGWARVTRMRPTAQDEYDMAVFLYRHGPIVACINAANLQFYTRSVWSNCGGNYGSVNHCVLLTGFGVGRDGTPYWVAKNSWGDDWGDEGYFFIQRNVNMCGIAEWVFAAYITL